MSKHPYYCPHCRLQRAEEKVAELEMKLDRLLPSNAVDVSRSRPSTQCLDESVNPLQVCPIASPYRPINLNIAQMKLRKNHNLT
jgi:hypothetical protein